MSRSDTLVSTCGTLGAAAGQAVGQSAGGEAGDESMPPPDPDAWGAGELPTDSGRRAGAELLSLIVDTKASASCAAEGDAQTPESKKQFRSLLQSIGLAKQPPRLPTAVIMSVSCQFVCTTPHTAHISDRRYGAQAPMSSPV